MIRGSSANTERTFSEKKDTAMTELECSVERSVEEMTKTGVFGPGTRFVSFALDGRHTVRDQFASTVLYGTVTVREDGKDTRAYRLVIKMKHSDPELRRVFKNDLQFSNEILFYGRIMQFLTATAPADRCPPFCRYFFGRNDCGDHARRDMIVLKNETTHGYRSARSEHKVFLDFDHVAVALRTLAKFHALSYRAKSTNGPKFMEIINRIRDTQWSADGHWVPLPVGALEILFAMILDRLAERTTRGGRSEKNETLRRFRTELTADAEGNLKRAMEPVEPLAVLCHGDFNRNNLMFRYDDRGKPVDALPFDMATVRYGSPALDLSFFFYMNTDRRLRDAHWDAMLDVYVAALATAVSDLAGETVPDRAQIDAELREHAFYGLAHVSFFLRWIMEEQNPLDTSKYLEMDGDERVRCILRSGGDKATDAIADAVQHFIDIKYQADTL